MLIIIEIVTTSRLSLPFWSLSLKYLDFCSIVFQLFWLNLNSIQFQWLLSRDSIEFNWINLWRSMREKGMFHSFDLIEDETRKKKLFLSSVKIFLIFDIVLLFYNRSISVDCRAKNGLSKLFFIKTSAPNRTDTIIIDDIMMIRDLICVLFIIIVGHSNKDFFRKLDLNTGQLNRVIWSIYLYVTNFQFSVSIIFSW